jgi:hypothetical protein
MKMLLPLLVEGYDELVRRLKVEGFSPCNRFLLPQPFCDPANCAGAHEV